MTKIDCRGLDISSDIISNMIRRQQYDKEAVPVRVRGGPSKHIPISNFAVESMARERT